MEVVKIQQTQMLCNSHQPDATDYNDWLGAPGFDWVDKAYEFGGWDLEAE